MLQLKLELKKNSSVLCLKRGGGKENSLVLFYVVCVQLESKRGREGIVAEKTREKNVKDKKKFLFFQICQW